MVKINEKRCIGCGACVASYPEIFELKDGKSHVKKDVKATSEMKAVCPVDAIKD